MRNWSVKCLLLAAALVLASPMSAAAQGKLGVGLSFLGDHGGTGVTVDYSKPFRTMANDRTLGWVGDFSFHSGDAGIDVDLTTLMIQGGIRLNGRLSEKVTWHVQGLVGFVRQSVDADIDDDLEDLCEEFDVDCDFDFEGSDSSGVITPGGGIDYWFNPQTALRAQLDIPIALSDGAGSTTRFWIGISRMFGQ
jgi:hypothetical protein